MRHEPLGCPAVPIGGAFRPDCYSHRAKWNRAHPKKELDVKNEMRNVIAALAVVAAGYAGSAAAQATTYVSDTGDVIRCESTQGRIDSCGKPTASTAEPRVTHCVATGSGRTNCGKASVQFVVKGGEHNPICVEGSTWGIDDGNLWVSGGCSAFF